MSTWGLRNTQVLIDLQDDPPITVTARGGYTDADPNRFVLRMKPLSMEAHAILDEARSVLGTVELSWTDGAKRYFLSGPIHEFRGSGLEDVLEVKSDTGPTIVSVPGSP